MFYPTNRFWYPLVVLACLSVAVAGVLYFIPSLRIYYETARLIILGSLGFWFALGFLDAATVPGRKRFLVERRADRIFSQGFRHHVTLEFHVRKTLLGRFRVQVADHAFESARQYGMPYTGDFRRGVNTLSYRIRIARRGLYPFRHIYLTAFSLMGLMRRIHLISCATDVRVYPDLKAISRYLLLARKSHLGLMGVRKFRRRGGDQEFERLRDYTRDDEFRHIDWKATARNQKLIVREYEMNRNQSVLFLVDCGRTMTATDESRSYLDYAINGSLLLTAVAERQQDRVGFLAFSDRVLRYVKPARNNREKIIQAAYDLEAGYAESDYEGAFRFLNTVLRKRTLLILLTTIIDDRTAEMVHAYLGTLSGKHLPFAVMLNAPDLHRSLESPPETLDQAFYQAGVADFLLWKAELYQKLKNRGVLVLDTLPEDLNAGIINEYLRIKARNLL
ncbi:MAG: DUF58 domain-containing protein [Leptospiraceae bacterium]|nr:DUF58 domain-containing protein [Leptospiraceae bacterium]